MIEAGIDNVVKEATELLGEQAGETIDEVTRDILVAGTGVAYASTATSRGGVGSGMTLTTADFLKRIRTLRSNNAKTVDGKNYVCIIHPNQWYDFYRDTTVQNAFLYAADKGGANPMFTGEIGTIFNTRVVVTSKAKSWTSLGQSGQDVYAALFLGKNAYGTTTINGLAMRTYFKPLGSGGATDDPLEQIASVGWKAYHTAARLNENFLTRLETAVSA